MAGIHAPIDYHQALALLSEAQPKDQEKNAKATLDQTRSSQHGIFAKQGHCKTPDRSWNIYWARGVGDYCHEILKEAGTDNSPTWGKRIYSREQSLLYEFYTGEHRREGGIRQSRVVPAVMRKFAK